MLFPSTQSDITGSTYIGSCLGFWVVAQKSRSAALAVILHGPASDWGGLNIGLRFRVRTTLSLVGGWGTRSAADVRDSVCAVNVLHPRAIERIRSTRQNVPFNRGKPISIWIPLGRVNDKQHIQSIHWDRRMQLKQIDEIATSKGSANETEIDP